MRLEKRHCMSTIGDHKSETEDALSYRSGRSRKNYLSNKGIARQMCSVTGKTKVILIAQNNRCLLVKH